MAGPHPQLGCVNVLGETNLTTVGSGYSDPPAERGYFSYHRKQKPKMSTRWGIRKRPSVIPPTTTSQTYSLLHRSLAPSKLLRWSSKLFFHARYAIPVRKNGRFQSAFKAQDWRGHVRCQHSCVFPPESSALSNLTPLSCLYNKYSTFLNECPFCSKTLPRGLW